MVALVRWTSGRWNLIARRCASCWRVWRRQVVRLGVLANEPIQSSFHALTRGNFWCPTQRVLGVANAWRAMLHVLVALAVVAGAFNFFKAGERRKACAQWMAIKGLNQHFSKLTNARLIVGVSNVENSTSGFAIRVLNDAVQSIHAFIHIGEATLLFAAIHQKNWRAFNQV